MAVGCDSCGVEEPLDAVGSQMLCLECEAERRGLTVPQVVLQRSGDGLLVVTTAPPAYDGFGTSTVSHGDSVLEMLDPIYGKLQGRIVRKVIVNKSHYYWQRTRYMSGGYLALAVCERCQLRACVTYDEHVCGECEPRMGWYW